MGVVKSKAKARTVKKSGSVVAAVKAGGGAIAALMGGSSAARRTGGRRRGRHGPEWYARAVLKEKLKKKLFKIKYGGGR